MVMKQKGKNLDNSRDQRLKSRIRKSSSDAPSMQLDSVAPARIVRPGWSLAMVRLIR